MKRVIGAVAAVLVVAAVVITLLWQPWRTSPITAQVPAPQEPEQPQAAPLVSLAEMQSRLSDGDLVTAALKRATCYQLAYASQQESVHQRGLGRSQKIRMRLGGSRLKFSSSIGPRMKPRMSGAASSLNRRNM
jgi:hypothetical protein